MWEGLGFVCPGAGKGSTGPIFTPKPEPLGGSTGPDSTGAADLIQNLPSSPPTPFANNLCLNLKLPSSLSLFLAEKLSLTLSYKPFFFPQGENVHMTSPVSPPNSDFAHRLK